LSQSLKGESNFPLFKNKMQKLNIIASGSTQLRNNKSIESYVAISNKLKILLINAFDMNENYSMYKNHLSPGHLLFGAVELNDKFDIAIPEQEKFTFLNKIGNWIDIPLLDQQIRALRLLSRFDILYAPFAATNTKLIVACKLFGLIRKPIIILVHHPLFGKPSRQRWKWLLAKKLILSYDTIIFLSEKMRKELIDAYNIDAGYADRHFLISNLGVDLDFYKEHATKDLDSRRCLVSSGNSNRDFDILIEASKKLRVPCKIYCKPKSRPRTSPVPDNVQVLSGDFPYSQICEDLRQASIVLIPLGREPQGIVGFTSLLEALALGKPVIMTKNKYIDIDLERENIGISVDEGDVDGWIHAISSLLDDHERLRIMGENSLRLAKKKFHINAFAMDLAKAIKNTYERGDDK
jgi:glycosyltransferase involved in cell wall biosynthesis